MKYYLFICLYCLTFISHASDNSFTLNASVLQTVLKQGQPFSYTLSLSGSNVPRNPDITFPEFSSQFTVRGSQKSQSFSFDSRAGTAHRSLNFVFTLVPNKIGNIIIEPATLSYNNQTYQSNKIKLLVTGNISAAPSSTQVNKTSTSHQDTQDIFANASVNKSTVFVGEQLIYTLELYRRIRLFSDIQHAVPSFTGFLSEPLSVNTEPVIKMLSGKKFYGQFINHTALFPIDPGVKMIESSQIAVVVSVFDGQKLLKSKPIKLTVKPLPKKNKPPQFSGVVGDYSLTGALDRYTISVGEPITYTLSLKGNGHLKSINKLDFIPDPQLKLYSSNISDDISYTNQVSGTRTFEYIIIPQKAGQQLIPTFSVSYFSPQENDYRQAIVASQIITVLPNAKAELDMTEAHSSINVIETDINYLKPIPNLNFRNRYPWNTILGLGFIIINFLIILSLSFIKLKSLFYRPDKQKLNSKKAYAIALKQLAIIQSSAIPKDQVISQLYKLVLVYLSSKVGTPFNGLTNDQIQMTLQSASFNQSQINALLSLINKISEMAYSTNILTDIQQKQLIDMIISTLKLMEDK